MSRIITFVFAGFMAALIACGGAQQKASPAAQGAAESPEWYNTPIKGCAVGSAKLRSILQAARDGAVASARADMAKQLEGTVQTMVKRYIREGEVDAKDFSEEDQRSVVRDTAEQTLNGVRVVKTASAGGQFYAMVCLDPETFGDAFSRMKTLSEKAREGLKKRAEEEFKDMDAQLDKIRNAK